MNTALQTFQYESLQLRIQQDENSEPLFHANDLCALLHYSNPRDAVARHVDNDDVVKRDIIDSMGRTQQANFLREPGLWALIMRSDAPNAKPVQRWVFADVLPSIRKTGGYNATHQPFPTKETLTLAEFMAAKDYIAGLNIQLDAAQVVLKGGDCQGLMDAINDKYAKQRQAAEDERVADVIIQMEFDGKPRHDIVKATGRSFAHVRQVIYQARRDGVLPLPANK